MTSAHERRLAIGAVLAGIKHLEQAQRDAATDGIVAAAGAPPSPPLMMRTEQVRNLRRLGMDVGAHTVTHPILTRLGEGAAREEMQGGKERLEEILGEHVRMARECGFSAAVSTAWGAASARSDRYQIPRFTPWDRGRLRFGARLYANLWRGEQRLPLA